LSQPADRTDLRELDLELLRHEFPPPADGSVYLNYGSCGPKPRSVLRALAQGWDALNLNPTRFTFLDSSPYVQARGAAAELFAVKPESILLTRSTTEGLQLLLQSFLVESGDELITTDHEHGATRVICRYLEETRGIVVRQHKLEPSAGSEALCQGMISLVTERTRLVEISEIDCYTGWRPDLSPLIESMKVAQIPVLVDGAHAPANGPCHPARYPLWVGSGHKWLGGPNGTGFAYVAPHLVSRLRPVWLGDRFYDYCDSDLARFESHGTSDVVRLLALAEACRLYLKMGPVGSAARQASLVNHLRGKLTSLPDQTIRTPDVPSESTGMLTVTFAAERVKVPDLRQELWEKHRIWVQPDFFYGEPGHGLRVSCHPTTTEEELDLLVAKLVTMIR